MIKFLISCENKKIILLFRRSYDIQRAADLCGDSYQCRYDYAMSLNRDMAHFTKNYYNTYTEIREINMKETGEL